MLFSFVLQVFHFRIDQENRAHNMFPQDMVPQMFSNIKSIYKFHHDFLLPQLEERMKNWEKESRIGTVSVLNLFKESNNICQYQIALLVPVR